MKHAGFHGRAGFGQRPALLVIDVNVGFTDPASPLVCDLDGVVASIGRLLDEFRRAELPVVYTTVSYDEGEIHEALQQLARRGWTRLASGAGSRAAKYRQLFDEAVGLGGAEVAVLCILMLRGPQTPGELNQRTGRLHAFSGIDEIHDALEGLAARGLVDRLGRRPGQKEERYEHLLGESATGGASVEAAAPPEEDRLGAFDRRLRELEERVEALEGA